MKRIRGLPAAPDGLARFAAAHGAKGIWQEFRDFESGAALRELTRALVEIQHGLCGYCEIDLHPYDTGVEHFIAQHGPEQGGGSVTAHDNLFAVCKGGENRSFAEDTLLPDPARYLPPVKSNRSCSAAKGNEPADRFIDPRRVPIAPSLFIVDTEGKIIAEPASCASHGIPLADVQEHIERLGLNVGRLRNQRREIWAALTEALLEFASLPPAERQEALTILARLRLLPNEDDRLARFFTTTRSFFGPLAQRILQQPPHAWL